MPDTLTAAQAAFVLGETLDVFRKAVERGPVRAQVVRRGGVRVSQFRMSDLVFLHADRELKAELTPKGRSDLYAALGQLAQEGSPSEVAFGDLRFDYRRHLAAVETRMAELHKLTNEIDLSGPEALIKGTAIEAHRIASLLEGGMKVEAVLHDYPSLHGHQVMAAQAYARAHPKPGRPYPKISAKAAMRNAGLDGLEEIMGSR